ncbi:hypothetical protein [Cupriavidus pampae]|nr:hypothetical protein [Cupriavidus pampae]
MATSTTTARWHLACVVGLALVACVVNDSVLAQGQPPSAPPVYGGGRGNSPGGLPDIPPPPRMLDQGTANAEGEGKPVTSQRQYCLGLRDKINTLAAPERQRVEDVYRRECAQQGR